VPTPIPPTVLTDELLLRCHDRAERAARGDLPAQADLEELRAAGYLRLPTPPEFGGPGLSLAQVSAEQRRLAYYAAGVATTVTAHLAWVGVAAELWRSGDRSLQWVLEEAARDQLFAAGHVERGNDEYLLASATRAERVDGGYRFTGYKSLDALGASWNYLGLHGVERHDHDGSHIVHAFLPRNTEGVSVRDGADDDGVGPARRAEALFDGAFVPDRFVARRVASGPSGIDGFVSTLLAWELMMNAQIACGLARRALDVTIDTLHRTPVVMQAGTMASDAGAQRQVARMGSTLEQMEPHVDAIVRQWARGTRHGTRWPMKLLAARQHATNGAALVIEDALDLVGSNGLFRHPELEQLARTERVARRHPASSRFTDGIVARTLLNMAPDHGRG
jgi:alkylation response protein AidB-like acyl-CoA dehydrogenase